MTQYSFISIVRTFLSAANSVVFTLFGLLCVTFFMGHLVPVDPVLNLVGDRASHETYQQARISLGLHLPIYEQFYLYLKNILRGDLGASFMTGNPVIEDLKRVFPATFELGTVAAIMGVALGVPLGILSAIYQGKWVDKLARIVALAGHSMPIFWTALVALLIFYVGLGWSPEPGRLDLIFDDFQGPTGLLLVDSILACNWRVFYNALSHLILPASILAYFNLAYISRMTRVFVLAELKKSYVLTAKIKGVPMTRIILRHIFKNIRIPLLTVIALSYGMLLEGSVLIETIFMWPGLGQYLTLVSKSLDLNAIMGGTVLIGIIFIIVNFLTDRLNKMMDPRGE